MQYDDIEWSVAAEDVFYAPSTERLYKVVSVGTQIDGNLVVTYTRLAGNGVCFATRMDAFKDGRYVPIGHLWLEDAFSRDYRGRTGGQSN